MELADGGSGEWMDSVQVQRQEGTDVVAQKQAESKFFSPHPQTFVQFKPPTD